MPEVRLRGGEIDGLALHYVVEGRGPAVVLLHGLGGFAESWRHTIPALADRATVYALALLGCAPLYRAAVARCLHAPRRAEVDFFVGHAYPERAGAPARAAYLATLRGVHRDFDARAQDYRRALATLDLPVLLIHGRQDRVVPAVHCAEVADALAHAAVRWVDACGHFPH